MFYLNTDSHNITNYLIHAASREAFRPFIRIKKHDLLFTTPNVLQWWDTNKQEPKMEGLVFLALLINQNRDMWSLQMIDNLIDEIDYPRTKWNEVYMKSAKKYPYMIKPTKVSKPPAKYPKRTHTELIPFKEEEYARIKSIISRSEKKSSQE